MTKSIRERARDKGFTPSVRDAAPLVGLLGSKDEDEAKDAERAISRLGAAALPALLEAAADAKPPGRARIAKAIGRLAPENDQARAHVLRALEDEDPKTRRNAIGALGKLPGSEDALLAAWAKETRPEHKRSLVEALGKVGGPRALEVIRGVRAEGDAELARLAARARMMLERTALREEQRGGKAIDDARAPLGPTQFVARCRAGLEPLLVEELGPRFEARRVATGEVRGVLRGPMRDLWVARTMLSFAFPMPEQRLEDDDAIDAAVVRALTGEEATRVFETWGSFPVRYRIAWAEGGHKRAAVWRAAAAVAARRPNLMNDPTESAWEVVVRQHKRFVRVELAPRALEDPRFAYRVSDVPAASHPTMAAAIARTGGAEPGDVVWDPFVGSGAELVERARLGPFVRMVGNDQDAVALEAARANLDRAEVAADLALADALAFVPPAKPTLVLTNPPMGRRIGTRDEAGELLDRFLDRLPRLVAPGARLAWISPFGDRTAARLERLGFRMDLRRKVDMGGFTAELQRATFTRARAR